MVRFEIEGVLERRLRSAHHSFDARRERERRVREHLTEQGLRRRKQLGSGNDTIHEPDAVGFCRVDHLARHEQLKRAPGADQSRETLRAPGTGYQADLNFRKCQHRLGMIGRDAIMRRERKLERTAHARAVNRHHQRSSLLLD